MMMLFAALLQAIQPAPPQAAPPEIQLDLRATGRRVVVERRGQTSLTIRTSINGREGNGNLVEVEAPALPQGKRELNDVEVRVRAEARLPDPLAAATSPQEPAEPQ